MPNSNNKHTIQSRKKAEEQRQSRMIVVTVLAACIALAWCLVEFRGVLFRPADGQDTSGTSPKDSYIIESGVPVPSDTPADTSADPATDTSAAPDHTTESDPDTSFPFDTDPLVTEPPVTNPPVTEPPQTEPPVTNPPVTEPPQTEPPVTNPPATEPPQTEPPVTNSPVTEPPQTEPPVTNPPVTEPPQTEPPVTNPPVTEPPQTEPPITNPPETEPPQIFHPVRVPECETVDDSFFADAVFIGDSRTVGLSLWSGLKSNYYSEVGLNVSSVQKRAYVPSGDSKLTLAEALAQSRFTKVYLSFGINEIGWSSTKAFISTYTNLVNLVKEKLPDADIYVQAILPMSKKTAESDTYSPMGGNDKIAEYNEALLDLCESEGLYFVDLCEVFADENGDLNATDSGDGIHLGSKSYHTWADYLRTHVVK